MRKTLIICLSMIEALFLFLAYTSYNNRDISLDDVKLKERNITNKKSYAIMIEQSDGTYTESESTAFPTNMVFNRTKSGCMDDDNNLIPNSLDYQNNKVIVTTNKTAYCYVYFDLDKAVSAYIPRLFASTNDTSKINKYTGPVTDECSANSCTTIQQAQNVYIFKSNDINNVIFEGFCWKVIRTTETGGIKLLYNGLPVTNVDHEECVANNGTNAQIGTSKFSGINGGANLANSPAYVGYMYNKTSGTLREMLYGVTNEEVTNETYGTGVYAQATNVNVTDSALKSTIETWFSTSGIDESKLEDAVYCNDRSLANNSPYSNLDTTYTYVDSTTDVYFKNSSQQSTLECSNITDSFNKANTKAQTNYKVGFMTEPERYLMGITPAANGQYYWHVSPRYFSSSNAYVNFVASDGRTGNAVVGNAFGVRPVVSINTDVQITSGNGSTTSPFITN